MITLFLVGRRNIDQSCVHLARSSAGFLVTTLLVPGVVVAFFALKGLWPEFRYCVFDFNLLAPAIAKGHRSIRFLVGSLVAFACVIYATRQVIRATGEPALASRRGFVLVVCGFYLAALYGIWVLRERQDYLPYHPLAFVFLTSAILSLSSRLSRLGSANFVMTTRLSGVVFPVSFALPFLAISLVTKPFWNDTAREETDLLRDILTLTNPNDYIFDCKGETVFRQRCFRLVLETITLKETRRRMIPDTVAQDCVETRTCVAVTKARAPLMDRMFLRQNYIPVERNFVGRNYLRPDRAVRVAGEFLTPTEPRSS